MTLIIITCFILWIRSMRKTPAQLKADLEILANYADPRLAMKRQEHDAKLQLYSARIAQAGNNVVKGDIEIEKLQLEILKLRRELSLDAPDFTPKNYPS